MELRIFDSDLTLKDVCDTAVKITATEQYAGAGTFSLTVPLSDAGRFSPEQIVRIPGVGDGYIVETVRQDAARGTAEVSGRGVLSYFDRRILTEEVTYTGAAEPLLLDLAAAWGTEVLPAPLGTVDFGHAETVVCALGDTVLFSAMKSVCDSAGVGMRLAVQPGGFLFSVRTEAAGALRLSRGGGDLSAGVRLLDWREYVNRVIVSGSDGCRVTVSAAGLFSDGVDDASLPVREMLYEAVGISPDRYASGEAYLAALSAEGQRILSRHRPVETVSFSVSPAIAGSLSVGERYEVDDDVLGMYGTALCTAKSMTVDGGEVRWGAALRGLV